MRLTTVILTKNNIETINRCIESAMNYYREGYIEEIIVVDGHSTDGTQEIVKKYPIKFFLDDHAGIANARNIGWRNASGDIILFLDSDAYLERGFLPNVLDFFEDENTAAVGCRVISVVKNNIMKTTGEWQSYHYTKLKKLINNNNKPSIYMKVLGFNKGICITGPVYLIRTKSLRAVGGFDERQKFGGEEISLSKKLIEDGWKATWWLDAPVFHFPRDTITNLIKERFEWGKGDCLFIIKSKDSIINKICNLSIAIISRIGSPVFAIWLAIKFKNPLHIIVFSMAQYSWIAGCFAKLSEINKVN